MSTSTNTLNNLSQHAPTLAALTQSLLFGEIWQGETLTPRERSIAIVSALLALYRLEQLPFHLQLARDNGLSQTELGELITHLAFYAGWPAAVSAVDLLAAQPDGK